MGFPGEKGDEYPKGKGKGEGKKGEKGEKGDRKGEKGEKGERKGDRKGEKGERKGDGKGEKGKGKRGEVKLISKGIRGKVISFITGKPSGFIQRPDGEKDVYFDLADVVDDEIVEKEDIVEFDIVEGTDKKLYAAKIRKLPKDTDLKEEGQSLKSTSAQVASKKGSLTGGGMTSGPKKLGSLTGGGLSLRPGGLTLSPGGGLGARPAAGPAKPKEEPKEDPPADADDTDKCLWGRIVSVRGTFGFLQQLGNAGDRADIFFRAPDVTGMNSLEPGTEGIEITLPHVRNSNGFKRFFLNVDDEVSFFMSKDPSGKPCASQVFKEKKGAWRSSSGRSRQSANKADAKPETLKDQMKRLTAMDVDEVLQNAMLFKEVLDSPDFDATQLYKIVSMLASKELAEDTRSDRLYRLFLESSAMQASLRTTIIKQGAGKHHGNFLEDCLSVIMEIVVRSPASQELRGQLPLMELVDAWENSVRGGSSVAKKGLPEDVINNLKFLAKTFPEEVNVDRVLKTKAPKRFRTAAEDCTEIMEADYYQDMPILPTSAEMIGQCAFEVQENMRTYEKCEDYIQTHFMLLREDYIEPLRAGIKLFMQGRHSPKDLHVYTGVKVVGVLSTWEGLVYRIELRKQEIRKVSWEKSKQLMYGSLLCFSDDDFKSLIWATVWRRDEKLIANQAQLDIRLPFEPWDDRLSPGKTFCCIENVTIYFEAYRHVLIAMQNMRPADVPFQNTLLPPQPDPVPPGFVKEESDMFKFHNIFENMEKANSTVNVPKSFKILQQWPETLKQGLDFDPSQLDALEHALTHQMALIQGPPGTGKTFVGLKIVQALLDNTREIRHSPVLVVCCTNHALDQFLEGIFKISESIVRIGSRSKSELMMKQNLKELLLESKPSREYFLARKSLMDRRDHLRDELTKALAIVDNHTVPVAFVKDVLSEKMYEEFYQGFLDWLGDDIGDFPEDPWVVDDDVFNKVMKAWLDTGDPSKFAPVIKKTEGGLPSFEKFNMVDEESDDDWELLAKDDGAEEEAAETMHDRKLEVEDPDEKKKSQRDFFQELHNPWLPYMEEYVETLSPEMRTFQWTAVENLWLMPKDKRRETYRQWLIEAHDEARALLPELSRLLDRNAMHRAALERDRKLEVLRRMQVVGMTTTAVSKYQTLLKELRPEIVMVEEAAEVLEAHILTALHPKTQHVVLIGDHQQLRPSTAVYRLSKNFHLDVSLFERLIHNGAEHVTLLQQRRMHPKVSRLIKPLYPLLRDHHSTSEYPEIKGVNARCFFMQHYHLEDDEGESHSKQNTFEANFVSALCAHLVKSGYEESQVTVLSPYLGQVRLLKQKIRRDATTQAVNIQAVDNFQGEESDIIVISLVRSNRARQMGFLAVDNRINVALTRARHGMFIVGNSDMLQTHTLWKQIIEELNTDQSIGDTMPLIDPENDGVFEVKSADEISVLLGDKLHETGGEGMITYDEYKKSQQAKKRKGGGKGKAREGAVADRWSELGKDSQKGGGKGKGKSKNLDSEDLRDGVFPRNERKVQPADKVESRPPPSKMEADGHECELVAGKAEQDDDMGKKGAKKKPKQQKQKQVLLVRG
mmetsp:Transcript_97527/g.173686  ORF Transcript_97527/g.173686 Transcript_97527/m.173686 type:complete len:1578 (+) Transcript_97527:459-5192(+)|eukprot:CAMPEP_0197642018 /NCGR_PEP_ID=MMETSP1338-20131121/15794_1 /TAXON_ID=43686 ORGANISM="Pelagodinium beii, Strain RCC1491" /NCGR_SAMPLE_ID=MMETSP1338 /ASSEMBLY_ACC=CAM_ASM_000754 /LENGTH=1577 /DNA_ID=CAMNT_0043215081 /DNA_START=411 /DNA_END=5144 /DNA_ORIENTATION=-